MADMREAIARLEKMDVSVSDLRFAITAMRAALSAPPEQPQWLCKCGRMATELVDGPCLNCGTGEACERVTPPGVESGSGQIEILICEACHSMLDPKHWRGMCHCGNGTVREMFTSTHPFGEDTRLLNKLEKFTDIQMWRNQNGKWSMTVEDDPKTLIEADTIRAAIEGEKK